MTGIWSGAWVTGALGVRLRTTAAPGGPPLEDLLGLAVRRNPRRAHLLVSTVLGKHVPTDPRVIRAAAHRLGAAVVEVLRADPAAVPADAAAGVPETPVVLGYAETATALGHTVAEALEDAGLPAAYLHSTRRRVATAPPVAGFEEAHSHATSHLLTPADPQLLATGAPLVLVDDELSTGATALATISALHAVAARRHYVVAALVDLRSAQDRAAFADLARRLGTRIDVVALAAGTVELPADVLERGRRTVEAAELWRRSGTDGNDGAPADPEGARRRPLAPVRRVALDWPVDLPDGGRHGVGPASRARLERLLPAMAAALDDAVGDPADADSHGDVLVLGTEELLHAPQRLAAALADRFDARADPRAVLSSSTTRSPVLAVDDPGYAVRTALAFPAHDLPPGRAGEPPASDEVQRYAYNVAPARGQQRFATVVVVVDDAGDTPALHAPGGLLAAVAGVCDRVLLVVLPSWRPLPPPLRGPDFGSYAPEEVAWLLTDLSGTALEAPTEEREEAVQRGGAHYAESLPVEYQPDAAYTALFTRALADSSLRLAHAVGLVTELVLARRGAGGRDVVLASLARAGTPVGILVRRWAAAVSGRDLPHYAVSIVRGRGLDPVALRHLAAAHDPASVVFVDAWTGKGAITRELDAAVAVANAALGLAPGEGFDSELAVLADPGGCTPLFGTRDDFLIPSACLGSTVSGLVSRTVLNPAVLAPGQFHGAKHYRELAGADVSAVFVDAVTARFADVVDQVRAEAAALVAAAGPDGSADAARAPTWAGWAAVEAIATAYGIGSVNLVKPGVGETTRVLLRRVPWRVLVRPGAGADLDHVRLLAAQRGVPVEEVPGLAYACVGLIHPDFTRGATGDDGTAVRPGVLPAVPAPAPAPRGLPADAPA